MKSLQILLLITFAFTVKVFSADTTSRVVFKPTGFRPTNQLLEGSYSQEGLLYETPCKSIITPSSRISSIHLDWKSLLNSGISSLLFEHKNYPNDSQISSYSIFANGNYSVINDETLTTLNSLVLGNQFMLKQIYRWALPYYKNAFGLLTFEEQQMIWNDLTVAELYINYVVEKKQHNQYNALLNSKHLKEDEKIIGFLKRRIDKKQWKIADCKYWISRIKNDVKFLQKNSAQRSSHYQVTEKVTNDLIIVTNWKGDFTLVNNKFKPIINETYKLILRNGNSLYAYRSAENNDFRIYSVKDIVSGNGKVSFPQKNWNSYYSISDSTYYFTTNHLSGIFDHKHNSYVIDSCTLIYFDEEKTGFFADRFFKKGIDEYNMPEYENTGIYYYDYTGKKIFDQSIYAIELMSMDEHGNASIIKKLSLERSSDNKIMVLENVNHQYGVIDVNGKIIIPFEYDGIDISNYPQSINANKNSGEERIFKLE
jgi:hypothetical protein